MEPSTAITPTLDQSGLGAEREDLAEEVSERLLVADPEAGDRRVVGNLVRADHPEGDVLAAAALDPSRGALADRVGVGEQGHHHLRIVRGAAVAVGAIGGVEGLEVELLDRLDHEPGEVVLGEPVAEVRRQQHRLVTVTAEEVLGHGPWSGANGPESRGFVRQPRAKARPDPARGSGKPTARFAGHRPLILSPPVARFIAFPKSHHGSRDSAVNRRQKGRLGGASSSCARDDRCR